MTECIAHFSGWLWANSNDIIASRNMLWRPPRSALYSALLSSVWRDRLRATIDQLCEICVIYRPDFSLLPVSLHSRYAQVWKLSLAHAFQGIKGVAAKCWSMFNQSVWSKSKLRSKLFPKMSCWLFSTWGGGGSLNKGKVGLPFTLDEDTNGFKKKCTNSQAANPISAESCSPAGWERNSFRLALTSCKISKVLRRLLIILTSSISPLETQASA